MAGNGTIGKILEDLPDPDAVLIPWGGGGLTVGIASAIKAQRPGVKMRVIAEGAGALAPAAALSGKVGEGKVVSIVSGGNIDFSTLSTILAGETPL
jgi:threonine dehydratase